DRRAGAGAARRNPGNRKLAALAAAWQPLQPGDTHHPPRPDAAAKDGVHVTGDVHGSIVTGDIRDSVVTLYGSYAGWPLWMRLALGAILLVALLTLAVVLWQRAQPGAAPTPIATSPATPEPAAVCRGGVAPSPEELAAMVAI